MKHNNYHTIGERYYGFAKVLSKDGYRVIPNKLPFSKEELNNAKILVVANDIQESNKTEWHLPNPSAFTLYEIDEIEKWVREDGSLFLVADHMPMPGVGQRFSKKNWLHFLQRFCHGHYNRSLSK